MMFKHQCKVCQVIDIQCLYKFDFFFEKKIAFHARVTTVSCGFCVFVFALTQV